MSNRSARLFGLFAAAMVLFNFPLLGVFAKSKWFGTLPAVLVYLFAVWLAVIVITRQIGDKKM
jgi:NADH:ubiquinone oxidoreductase subunit K